MKNFSQLCLIALLALPITACVFIDGKHVNLDDWREVQEENREAISQLSIGLPRSVVVERLGAPADSEAYTRDDDEMRVLFYRTRHRHSDGETSRDETTPLVFRNDELVGWGDRVYAASR